MARIAGVNIPTNKRVVIALQYIHGIGPKKAEEICAKVSIPAERRVNQLTDAEVLQIRETIDRDYMVEGDLRREVAMNIKRLMDLVAIAACAIAASCRFAASARTPTPAPARARRSRSPARRSNSFPVGAHCPGSMRGLSHVAPAFRRFERDHRARRRPQPQRLALRAR